MQSTKDKMGRKFKTKDDESPKAKKRMKRILLTLDSGLTERRPFERNIKKNLLLYSGQSPDKDIPDKVRFVSPLAYIFCEAKTAEEVRAMSEFEVTPVEDSGDSWKIPFIKDITAHVESKVRWRSKRIHMIRMKNVGGVSIARVGYRFIEGKRKIGRKYDEKGRMIEWDEKTVPVYDDMFIDIVPPLDFVIDPNAISINDAQWCGHFHAEHIDDFREAYGNDERFYNVLSVKGGENDMIGMYEHFNKTLDEYVTFAFPFTRKPKKAASEMISSFTEIGNLPLADDHGMLPFFSYHNFSRFADDKAGIEPYITEDGEPTSSPCDVRDRETFWTDGVPTLIEDLIDLSTDFGRSAYRALKLAGQVIHLTAGNYSLDEAIPWQAGMQAIGGLNKVQSYNLGAGINIGSYQFAFQDLFEKCVMVVAVDPRNLTDTKVKTLGEAEMQNETAARRLALGITFNEEMGETQRGWLMVKDEQQYYTIKEMIRLTGRETKKDLADRGITDVYYSGKTPIKGKRFRKIKSSKKLKESKDSKIISVSESGVNSFLSREEYISTSELDVRVVSKKRVDQSDAVTVKRYDSFLERITPILNLLSTQQNQVMKQEEVEKITSAVSSILDGYIDIFGLKENQRSEDDTDRNAEMTEARKKIKASPIMQAVPTQQKL